MSGTGLTRTQRLFVRGLHHALQLRFGGSWLVVHEESMATLGWARFLKFLKDGTMMVTELTKRFGEADAQFSVSLAAMWNGCGVCSYGHSLAGSLLVFRDTGRLHPLCPEVIDELQDLRNDDAAARLDTLLAGEEHAQLRRIAAQMYALRMGRVLPRSVDDRVIEATSRMWDWYTECSIVVGMTLRPEDASCQGHPVGRDTELLARYGQARAEERSGS